MADYRPAGDCGIVVEFGDTIDPDINRRVRAMAQAVRDVPGLEEVVPTYRSLLIVYNPLVSGYSKMLDHLAAIEVRLETVHLPEPREITIPTLYGGEFGPDLDFVARYAGLTPEEVIEMHSAPKYIVYMLGFLAGYPYLGGLPQKLAVPRLERPRLKIPAGSVGIGGQQTGIYPIESPGGWRIIGVTRTKLFDPTSNTPFLLRAGDFLKFSPIIKEQYLAG